MMIDLYPSRYVSEQMGGAVERSGPLGYELPAGHVQHEQQNNLVPLGEIKIGAFQHRALLFKVTYLGVLHTAS